MPATLNTTRVFRWRPIVLTILAAFIAGYAVAMNGQHATPSPAPTCRSEPSTGAVATATTTVALLRDQQPARR